MYFEEINIIIMVIYFSAYITTKVSSNHCSIIENYFDKFLISQDQLRIKDIKSKNQKNTFELKSQFYKSLNQPLQTTCKILKKFGGTWGPGCGQLDGEKMICMELLYEDIKNNSCLVYSFGLGDDWVFELALAELGTVRAIYRIHFINKITNLVPHKFQELKCV